MANPFMKVKIGSWNSDDMLAVRKADVQSFGTVSAIGFSYHGAVRLNLDGGGTVYAFETMAAIERMLVDDQPEGDN